MAISYREAERRIKALCGPQADWLQTTAKDQLDRARLIGYEDGVRDALVALRNPAPRDREEQQ